MTTCSVMLPSKFKSSRAHSVQRQENETVHKSIQLESNMLGCLRVDTDTIYVVMIMRMRTSVNRSDV